MIPVNQPLLDGNEKTYLMQCIESGWISSEGPFVSEFESKLADRVGRSFGVAVSNGTAALDAAIEALGLGPGDEVILPTFTIISCISQIVRAGAVPVLVDSDPTTWNMDVTRLSSCITSRTRAIMVVHTYGLPVDMDPVLELAARHGITVIEDAAEAIGQTYRGRPCGSFGHVSVFSFYPNKHVTTGEGGMLVCDDPVLAEELRSVRNLCFQPTRRFVHEKLGWNLRMTNMQAALGVAQLERLDEFILKKRSMGARYNAMLADIPGIQLPVEKTDYADNHYWVYGIVLDETHDMDARTAMQRLGERGVGTRPFFWPMHQQPVFLDRGMFGGCSFPVSERIARRGFYIPSGLALTVTQMEEVALEVRRLLA